MFKLVVLSAVLAIAAAAPSGHYLEAAPIAYAHEPVYAPSHVLKTDLIQKTVVKLEPEVHSVPAVAKVGEYVQHVPHSVSHHSSSVVHNTAAIHTPVIAAVEKAVISHEPVLKTVHAPVVQQHVPLVHSAPLLHSAPLVHSAPLAYSAPLLHSAPLAYSGLNTHSLHGTQLLHGAPLAHSIPSLNYAHSW